MNFKLPMARAAKVAFAGSILAFAASAMGQDDPNAELVKRRAAQALDANPNQPYNPYVVLVKFRPGYSESYKAATRAQVGGGRLDKLGVVPGLESISTQIEPSVAVRQLGRLPWVEYAEVDYTVRAAVTPNDPNYGLLWGLHNTGQSGGVVDADIDAPEAWDLHTGTTDMRIAVIDTGIQTDHPDLAANIWVNPGETPGNGVDDDSNGYIDDINGWNFVTNTAAPADGHGHGTHCAGTIGAVGNNGVGVTGINWRVKLVGLKFLSDSGTGSTSNAILAVNYCRNMGIKVSNNSWGGGGFSQSMYDAIQAAGASGHLFVAAAGNNGSNNDASPFYPAAYTLNNIISVAATNRFDNRSGFSNYGATSVDLGAPGESIVSTVRGSGYGSSSGTSMASPHVAGAAALLWSYKPTWTYEQVKDGLLSTVRTTPALNGITLTGGVLNVNNALVAATPTNSPPTVSITSPANGTAVVSGANLTFTGTADDTQDGNLSANINWSSNVDGTMGTGSTINYSSLSLGTHTVTASVTDAGGLTGSATVSVTIEGANEAPTVTITAPSNNSSSNESASVTFSGSVNDDHDSNLAASLAWNSSRDGAIGNGASFSKSNLSVGTHVITATVTDAGGLQGSANITITVNANTAPVVTISSPTTGSTVTAGDSVTFSGSSQDTQQGDLSAGLAWTSSLDGNIGTGSSFSRSNLSVGTHTITARSTDALGAQGSATVTLTVNAVPNDPPNVTITSPGNGLTFASGASISFTGTAQDPQDGNVTSSLVWSSNLSGQIGTGGSFSTTLSPGTHVITAVATDALGLTGQAQVTVTVTAPETVPASPSNLRGQRPNKSTVRLTWHDNSSNELGFTIERETRVGKFWVQTATFNVGANTTLFEEQPDNGQHRYRVRAYNNAGASDWEGWAVVKL